MADYTSIRESIRKERRISSEIIDNFLIPYAAVKDKLKKEFDSKISRFDPTFKTFSPELKGLLVTQYIGHRVFRKDGLIKKYLKHAALKDIDIKHKEYLQKISEFPFRYSISEITANPAADFYEMEDVITGETYLLFSESVTRISKEYSVILWFNLIHFNGECWETFGLVTGYRSFDLEDIFFYANVYDKSIQSLETMAASLEHNPIPYMMLVAGANYPLVSEGEFEIIHTMGNESAQISDISVLKSEFGLEYSQGVYKLRHDKWSVPPHLAEAYYDETKGEIFITAVTDQGYFEMASSLNEFGLNLSSDPGMRIHLPMIIIVNKVLKTDIELNPYRHFFDKELSPENDQLSGKLNELLALALPYLNDGKEPDINAMAKQIGMDPDMAREMLEHVKERMGRI